MVNARRVGGARAGSDLRQPSAILDLLPGPVELHGGADLARAVHV